ncbi:MAG: DUF6249 domain-containing protein [Bacteroidales bacterium]|jgi:hypothetical protein|nr:DUF6249 domain-containing protein [Bacteroidales bacterium]
MEGILAILGIFFMPIVLVILLVWFKTNAKNKLNQLQADLYAKAIEKGQELPANFFVPEIPAKKNSKPLNIGIILIAAGVGISVFFLIVALIAGHDAQDVAVGARIGAGLGVIPFLIGIAYLIIYFIGKKQAQKDAK